MPDIIEQEVIKKTSKEILSRELLRNFVQITWKMGGGEFQKPINASIIHEIFPLLTVND